MSLPEVKAIAICFETYDYRACKQVIHEALRLSTFISFSMRVATTDVEHKGQSNFVPSQVQDDPETLSILARSNNCEFFLSYFLG